MNCLYIDQVSISFFTQLLLLGIIILYLLTLDKKSSTTWLVVGIFTGIFCIIIREFLVTAMPWQSLFRFQIRPLVYIALYLGMIALLQFIYRFPDTAPEWPREAKVIRWLSEVIVCTGLGIWCWQYFRFTHHDDAHFGNIELIMECSVLIEFVWAIIVLVRRAISASLVEVHTPPGHARHVILDIIRPQSRKVRGIQRFILYFGGLMLLLMVSILLEYGRISQQTYNILYSTGFLLAIFFSRSCI